MHRRWLQTSWKLVSKCLHLRDINGNVYECCCPGVSASLTSSFSAGRVEPHLFPSHGGDVKLNEIGHVRCLPLIIRTYTACVVLTLSWWWSWWWSRQTGRQAGSRWTDGRMLAGPATRCCGPLCVFSGPVWGATAGWPRGLAAQAKGDFKSSTTAAGPTFLCIHKAHNNYRYNRFNNHSSIVNDMHSQI